MKPKLPSIKPNQLGLMIHEASGRVLIVLKKPNDTIALKDVTTDFTLMLAAGILKEDAKGTVQEFVATDSFGNELTLQVTAEIISEKKVQGA